MYGPAFPAGFKKTGNPPGFFEVAEVKKGRWDKKRKFLSYFFLTSILINIQLCFYVSQSIPLSFTLGHNLISFLHQGSLKRFSGIRYQFRWKTCIFCIFRCKIFTAMISEYVDIHSSAASASKKIKVGKKSRDLKISTDAKTESKCVIFWKCCPCLNTKKKRARQAKRAIAFFCLCVYCFDVGSDLRVGFDLKQRCHHLTGNIL